MKDDQCVRFLQWALPQMYMRWPGFRKVRRQVCKRVGRRMKALGLTDIDEYQNYLETHADEWAALDSLCHITISRFSRDRGVFTTLADAVLPELLRNISARRGDTLRDRVLTREDDTFHLHANYRRDVTFLEQDVREACPVGPFDLVLCRNLVFTYFDDELQAEVLSRIIDAMAGGAVLVIGIHEDLPESADRLEPWFEKQRIYRKTN